MDPRNMVRVNKISNRLSVRSMNSGDNNGSKQEEATTALLRWKGNFPMELLPSESRQCWLVVDQRRTQIQSKRG